MIGARLSLESSTVLLLSSHTVHCVRFFVLAETLPTVCETSFFLRKCISCTSKTQKNSKGSATSCPNSGPISGRTPPSVWTPRPRPEVHM